MFLKFSSLISLFVIPSIAGKKEIEIIGKIINNNSIFLRCIGNNQNNIILNTIYIYWRKKEKIGFCTDFISISVHSLLRQVSYRFMSEAF